MSEVLDIIDSVKGQLREPDDMEVTVAQVQTFINDAVQDARNSGWLLPIEDDESLTFLANTYEYEVPAGFVYIRELRIEDTSTTPVTWSEEVPGHLWEMRVDGGDPMFFFHRGYALPVGRKMKVIGQKNLTAYSALDDTIDPGMESFLRTRALYFALGFVSPVSPETDQQRLIKVQQAYRDSEFMLARQPMRFRVKPSSRIVPGR